MVNKLSDRIPSFGGATSHTWCFLHVVNLVAKSFIHQFDVSKKEADAALNGGGPREAAEALAELSAEVENEDGMASGEIEQRNPDGDGETEIDNDDGWTDEVGLMGEDEREEFTLTILPIKLALAKIRKLAFKVTHSSTVILPAWKELMRELRITVTFLPHDVATRWNSTLDLLDCALRHRKVVDGVTQRRDLGLRKYEVLDEEWTMIEQLRSVLEVS
ncbi:hypothetical protein OG21DRAFT_397980 [Imleria badia]|nr:hypothetical protein OG21DRAFT_397980 [Imleria badia]